MCPKRTNDFQALVALIEAQVASPSCTVTESNELLDRHTGKRREVDVVIEARVADHDVTVSIECTSTARPATIEWVEQMAAKHDHLPTSKLVLVSRSGFTEEAIQNAHTRGIEAWSIEEASAKDWRILINLEELVLHHRRLHPTAFKLTVRYEHEPLLRGLKVGDTSFVLPPDATRIRAATIVESAMADQAVRQEMSNDKSGPEQWKRLFDIQFPPSTTIELANGRRVPVQRFSFELHYSESQTLLPLTYGAYAGRNIAFGTAKSSFGDVVVVMVEPVEGQPAQFLLKVLPGSNAAGRNLELVKHWADDPSAV